MGKKLFSLISFLSLFLIFALSVNAQSTAPTSSSGGVGLSPTLTAKQMLLEKRQEIKTTYQTKNQELKQEFKDKFAAIRDERKKVLAQNIDEKIAMMNKNHTTRLSEVLAKLEKILDRINTASETAKGKGLNTVSLDNAIANAKVAISSAKDAVSAQAAKVYNIQTSTDTTLKANVGVTVSMFRKDLNATHKIVVDAKQSVMKAEMELAKIRGEQKAMKKEGTTVTPSVTAK